MKKNPLFLRDFFFFFFFFKYIFYGAAMRDRQTSLEWCVKNAMAIQHVRLSTYQEGNGLVL